MDYAGVNMTAVRSKNKSSVLHLLNKRGELSRKDLAEELDLTPAAVSILCSGLLSEGLIAEKGEVQGEVNRAGRRKILLTLCLDRFFAVAVNMETDETSVSLVRLDGKVISDKKLPTERDAQKAFREIARTADHLLREADIPKEQVKGVGLGIVGAYDAEKDETAGEYGIFKKGITVARRISELTGFPVCCENNVKAFALAQLLYGGEDDNMLFVKWGSGVGSALVLSGKVVPGAQEIGHYIIDPNGRLCRCGRHGCLETHVSAAAITQRIGEVFSPEKTPVLFEKTGGDSAKIFSEVCQNGVDGLDKTVAELVDRRINRLARAVVNTATVLEPNRVCLFGHMWNEEFLRKFQRDCQKYCVRFDEQYVRMSPLQDKADFIGPTALVAERFYFESGEKQ